MKTFLKKLSKSPKPANLAGIELGDTTRGSTTISSLRQTDRNLWRMSISKNKSKNINDIADMPTMAQCG